jgi:hypothetical protein
MIGLGALQVVARAKLGHALIRPYLLRALFVAGTGILVLAITIRGR